MTEKAGTKRRLILSFPIIKGEEFTILFYYKTYVFSLKKYLNNLAFLKKNKNFQNFC